MPKIVPIVEGYGELEAVPNLLTRILHDLQCWDFYVENPKNAHGCGNLTKPGGVEKFVELCQLDRTCDAILILMDADQSCGVQQARVLAERIRNLGVRVPTVIVFAQCEYESWFLASIESIAGQPLGERPGLQTDLAWPEHSESIVGAKSWLDKRMPEGRIYKETEDQVLMTRLIDLTLAQSRSRSFRRLQHAVEEIVTAIQSGAAPVTP
jgi:hypothetical protein